MSNELITIDVPELKIIEQSRAATIANAFIPVANKLHDFKERFDTIMAESASGITDDIMKKARRLRLDIVPVRTEAGRIKDKQKEGIKKLDGAIMGVYKFFLLDLSDKEKAMMEIEKTMERIQEEKRQALQKEREEQLSQYVDDTSGYDLAGMQPEVWEAFISSSKQKHEARIEAEKKAEAERIENERLDNLERTRLDIILPYRNFWTCDNYALREMSDTNFDTICCDLKSAKEKQDAENERIRLENEQIRKEKEAAAEKARKEKEEIERKYAEGLQKAREEAKRIEHERAEERRIAAEKQAAIEAELKAKKDAEEKAKREKEEAEKKAARAPDKDKIAAFIALIESLPVPEVKTIEGKKLAQYISNQLAGLVTTLKTQNAKM